MNIHFLKRGRTTSIFPVEALTDRQKRRISIRSNSTANGRLNIVWWTYDSQYDHSYVCYKTTDTAMLNLHRNDSSIVKIKFDSVKYITAVVSYHGGGPAQRKRGRRNRKDTLM